jgi:tetratricopeptide (TPR) repeat protein
LDDNVFSVVPDQDDPEEDQTRPGKGMEAMASRRPTLRFAQLWQVPLLLLSLGLFAYAAWMFFDIRPGQSIDQKMASARTLMTQERPEAAIDYLNQLLNTAKFDVSHEGRIHLMLAESLEMLQKQKPTRVIPAYHEQIVQQCRMALSQDVAPTAAIYRRLAESYEAMRRPIEALDNYRRCMAIDPERSLRMQRKIIDLQLGQDDFAAAGAAIREYLAHKELSDSERAWAAGESAHLMIDQGEFEAAKKELADAARLNVNPVDQGQLNYWEGYCAWKLGDADEAERSLRVARDQLRATHPLDGDACYVLGRLAQARNDPRTANSFYEIVLVNHPDAKIAPLARLSRGVCRILEKNDDGGLNDLHEVVRLIDAQGAAGARYRDEAVAGLRDAAQTLTDRGNYVGAIEALAYEQTLRPQPTAGFFARLGDVYEKQADQLAKASELPKPADRIRRDQQLRDDRTKAGDAYVAYSRALTLLDDKTYGDALWHGIDLYDQAGDLRRAITALQLFVAERPEDSLTPEALLRLGRAYQAAGMFDKAVATFQQIQFRYSKSFAASKCAVPLAQAYLAKGPDFYAKAETVLLSVLENNPVLTPEAQEFRQSLFELAGLYYRTSRFEEAVSRLEELVNRYPDEQRLGQLLFLMADSYRKSANLLRARVAATTNPSDAAEALAAKRERLAKARGLYERTIDAFRASPPGTDLDRLYQKLSYFYRADCVYDLGNYDDAIHMYDAAAFRYQEDPAALAAYVQIVNANCALGRMDEARTANERAKWLLKRMPAEAFDNGAFTMPKEYWDQWLKWSTTLAVNQ